MKTIKNILKNHKVDLILFLVSLGFLLSWFITGYDSTPFLAAVLCLYLFAAIREKYILGWKLNFYITEPDVRTKFGLPRNFISGENPKDTLFALVIKLIITAGTIFMIVMFFIQMLGK